MPPPYREPTTKALIRRIRPRLRRRRDSGIVVAVSGGSDSVGLLRLLHELAPELGLRLAVAHLDHGVRGAEAEADARFVADLAARLGLPCELGRWSPERPGHFEADARSARYDFLVRVARERKASCVAVGHTRDDQAETVLHRVLRGTGLRGLAGIPRTRRLAEGVTLIRPLLEIDRLEIRDYLDSAGQPFREDATNADTSRTRARLRHDLLPKLAAEYNPRVAEALARLGDLAGAASRAWERRLLDVVRSATLPSEPTSLALDRAALRELPRVLRAEAIRLAWRRQGWPERKMTAARWRRLARLVEQDTGRASVGGGVDVRCSREAFELIRPLTAESSGAPPFREGMGVGVRGMEVRGGEPEETSR